jgi:deoxyribonuclease-4
MVRRLGLHTSIAGSLENAALEAVRVGANTLQIFSASPRMWRARPPDAATIARFRALREKHDLRPLAIHDNYLINLASCDEALRVKSRQAFRGELERALAIGAEYLVAHPGNCKGHSIEQGMVAVVRSLVEAADGLDTKGLTVLLENMAGAGNALGSRFEELADMRRYAAEFSDLSIGFCVDTCHTLATGFDIANVKGLNTTVAEIDRVLDLANVPVIHANDSKMPLGSRVDRHQNIGEGYIGEEGFRRILNHPELKTKAFILETPVDKPGDDVRNLETLKRLARKKAMR